MFSLFWPGCSDLVIGQAPDALYGSALSESPSPAAFDLTGVSRIWCCSGQGRLSSDWCQPNGGHSGQGRLSSDWCQPNGGHSGQGRLSSDWCQPNGGHSGQGRLSSDWCQPNGGRSGQGRLSFTAAAAL